MRYRHEYKYLIDARQEAILQVKVAGLMDRDQHSDVSGSYLIRSLYFDDLYDSCVWDNLAGADPRSKYRIRYYGTDTTFIRLEKKVKERSMTRKDSCQLTIEECRTLMDSKIPDPSMADSNIKAEMFEEMQRRGLYPKTIVTYERSPYIYPGGNVRVTFDRDLSSSYEVDKFLTQDYIARPVFPLGQSVLEVKWDEVMPCHIKDVMHLENLQWTAFSKYYMCRKIHL